MLALGLRKFSEEKSLHFMQMAETRLTTTRLFRNRVRSLLKRSILRELVVSSLSVKLNKANMPYS